MITWLYLPNGCKVQFEGLAEINEPVSEADKDYQHALAYTNRLLALGASVNAPGLEDGEQKEQVGYVVYRSKVNDDATETPIIDLYLNHDATKFKFLTVYLNSPDDVATFENTSGLLLSGLPYWEGGHLERGNPKTDKYFIAPRKPLTVVHKLNERYNPDEPDMTKRKPKRLFVRWESAGIPTPAQQPAAAQPPANPFAGQSPPAVQTTQNAQTGEPDMSTDALKDIWNIAPSGAQWSRLRKWLFTNVYENNQYAIDGSMAKHAKQTQNWKRGDGSQMTVGDIVRYLQTRHEGEKQGLQDAS